MYQILTRASDFQRPFFTTTTVFFVGMPNKYEDNKAHNNSKFESMDNTTILRLEITLQEVQVQIHITPNKIMVKNDIAQQYILM